MVVPTWRGVVAPKGTPKEALDYLSAIEKVVAQEGFQKYLAENQLEAAYLNSTDFALFVAEQDLFYKNELKELGLVKKK